MKQGTDNRKEGRCRI